MQSPKRSPRMKVRVRIVASIFVLAAILLPLPSALTRDIARAILEPLEDDEPNVPTFDYGDTGKPLHRDDPPSKGNDDDSGFEDFPVGRKANSPRRDKKAKKAKQPRDAVAGNVDDQPLRQPEEEGQPEPGQGGLRVGFYAESCPRAEEIVKEVISNAFKANQAIAAGLVRLHFHDCFVRGCDASVLLDRTPTGEQVEKISSNNGITLKGTEIIDAVKTRLEEECPNTVSCADIIAFASRDALNLTGVPNFEMPSGRRDGRVSLLVEGDTIPGPEEAVEKMIQIFQQKGLTMEEMVVLVGAHSIGDAHCSTFDYRVKAQDAARVLDERLLKDIAFICQDNLDLTHTVMAMDSGTQFKMDADFYKQLLARRGLLEFDQKMADFPTTGALVRQLADDEDGWLEKFSMALVKMAGIEVLTGTQGEIRRQCRFVN